MPDARTNHCGRLVRLRAAEPSDAEFLHALERDGDAYTNKAGHAALPWSFAAVSRDYEDRTTKRRDGDEVLLIVETHSGEGVGLVFTHHVNRRVGSFEYGLQIAAQHHRNGYASEAISLLLAYFFDELRYEKANVSVFDWNDASLALHESLGFVREGRIRRATYTRGEYRDEFRLGITREEFDARRRAKPEAVPVALARRPHLPAGELQDLFRYAWGGEPKDGYERVLARSLTWVAAYADVRLGGFVNVAWDGGGPVLPRCGLPSDPGRRDLARHAASTSRVTVVRAFVA